MTKNTVVIRVSRLSVGLFVPKPWKATLLLFKWSTILLLELQPVDMDLVFSLVLMSCDWLSQSEILN